jgi:ATP synthase protein I
MAMELPFILIGGIVIGGGLGWLLDRQFHTSPGLTLLGGTLGFGGGMWDILKRLSRAEKDQGKDDAGG